MVHYIHIYIYTYLIFDTGDGIMNKPFTKARQMGIMAAKMMVAHSRVKINERTDF